MEDLSSPASPGTARSWALISLFALIQRRSWLKIIGMLLQVLLEKVQSRSAPGAITQGFPPYLSHILLWTSFLLNEK
jgi:hypothetical protein